MDVRGKLIDLLTGHSIDTQQDVEYVADHLIRNGVTVQEGIKVKDELPEDNSDVLAYSRSGEESRIYLACYSNGVWFDCVFNAPATDTTTHWMPLPSTEGIEDDT